MSLHAPARSGDDLSSSNIGDLGGDKEPYKLGEIEWTGNGKEKGRELKKKKVFLTRHMPMLGRAKTSTSIAVGTECGHAPSDGQKPERSIHRTSQCREKEI
jgi:hypothetical protein